MLTVDLEESMLVRELQEQLSKLRPDLEVLCYTEDEELQGGGHIFRLFDIEAVTTTEGEKVRGDDGVPSLKFQKSDISKTFATLDVTLHF